MQATRGNLTLEIHQDLDPIDPRTEELNLGVMACWHTRYRLGDSNPRRAPTDWLELIQRERPSAVMLPLFLLDHSGLRLSTAPFGGPHGAWDSGQVGWIFTHAERAAELGIDWDPDKARAELEAEVRVYDSYLAGEVYGFRLLQDGEEIASCWGFYGTDWKTNGLIDHLPEDARALLEVLE